MKRILAIDGGGIKGVFPASFLATVENSIGGRVADYFDLIVGTSTGGIIALGLGLGLSASEILRFYEQEGPQIFCGNRLARWLRQWGIAKYDAVHLRQALETVFGERRLGDSTKRLVVPSCNLDTGEVHIWKTAHHPRLERDFRERAVDVALATAAAPTYFPTHRSAAGTPLVDGGTWANNPAGIAVVEAVGVLGWPKESVHVLSLGCTTSPLQVVAGRNWPLGRVYWAAKLAGVFMAAQSSASIGIAIHLLGDRERLVRISPAVGSLFSLDRVREIPSLKGLGDSEARKALPSIRPIFFKGVAEPFVPVHTL
jgi:uncharacterized membrane protein